MRARKIAFQILKDNKVSNLKDLEFTNEEKTVLSDIPPDNDLDKISNALMTDLPSKDDELIKKDQEVDLKDKE